MKITPRLICCSVLCSLVTAVSAAPAIKKAEAKEGKVDEAAETTIGPDYANAPETQVQPNVPKGEIHEFTMDSKDSKIYKGIAKNQKGEVPYQRKVAVYVPSQYRSSKEAPFIVIQDGMGYRDVVSKVLDNMIDQKRLPVMVAVFVNSGGGDAQGSQRGLEYDTLDGNYTMFIEKEVLPKITKDYRIKFTTDPEGRATMGGSSGAAAAFTMAWYHPELYRKVLSYSGTYVNQQFPEDRKTPHGAWEYHENLIKRSAAKPIRAWLEVSEKDNGWDRDEASLHNWVMANERMAAELKAKNYAYRYVFAKNAGHVDGKVTWQTLPGALEWLWQGYQAK
ncbi:MAG: alpha/beta hydrolase-fold protein [Luteolibacter sp.]|uniref:alpha/beta hydrolase n=1 Tax=Luteolibacter sp. TaxID=1962973 RepID=UPI003265A95D